MNESGANAKQQIVERIKNSSNILVTVSTNPTVDELSAALGLTIMLNKLKKHATAVVSGELPQAMAFLDPEKVFENTVDSLRDFIIALDKEKADHLRYKVDGDVVKIFITPYRTTITSDDLDFSQGDYNVELVIGLGVRDRDHLDSALAAHGRILHDATVATLTAGDSTSELGSIDWHEDNASSLSEMLVALSESLKADKPILDEQIATALLTGIVAATDRFSNNHTSSRVMTMAAQLMAAGANQQLIAAKLQEAHEIGNNQDDGDSKDDDSSNNDGTTDLSEGESTKLNQSSSKKTKKPKKNDGELSIAHEPQGDIETVGKAITQERQEQAAVAAEEQLAKQLDVSTVGPADLPSVADLQKDLAAANADVEASAEHPKAGEETPEESEKPVLQGAVRKEHWSAPQSNGVAQDEPHLGGTLNATTEQAADDKRREEDRDRNHTILSHGGYLGDSKPTYDSPINSVGADDDTPASVDPFASAPNEFAAKSSPQFDAPSVLPSVQEVPAIEQQSTQDSEQSAPSMPTLADIDAQNRAPSVPHADDARAAVEQALQFEPTGNNPFDVAPTQVPVAPEQSPPPMPPMPDFSTLPPPLPPTESFDSSTPPSGAVPSDKLGDIFAPDPNAPQPPSAPEPPNPGQFRIPGQ